jgi:hypothetical protein
MRLLNLLGVEIGPEEDLLAPGEGDNARGYWEPRWMIELNDEILARLGSVWWRPLNVEAGWERSSELDELRERARSLLAEKFGTAPLWGWKDPRTTVTLPFWKELVPDAKYVICLRNPADAISSIQRRPDPNLPVETWGDLWLEYTARALKETQDCRRTLVFYEDYFQEPDKPLGAMARLLDLPYHQRPGSRQRLYEEIEQTQRHHATSPRELAATWGIPPAARTLFLALRAAEDARSAAGTDEAQPIDAVARVAHELWWGRRTLTDLRGAFPEAQQTIAVLQSEQAKLTEALAQSHGEAAELQTLAQRSRDETASVRDVLQGTRLELESAHDQLEGERKAVVARTAELEHAHATQLGLEDRLARQAAILDKMQSSVSWRVTVPLRAAKRAVTRQPQSRPRSEYRAADQSLLAGATVNQVWWFALLVCFVVAATDTILTHVVLITLLAAGPLCAVLTGRWARTAALGALTILLAVALGVPDGIWDTRTQLVNLCIVASLASLCTIGAALIQRSRRAQRGDLTPLVDVE